MDKTKQGQREDGDLNDTGRRSVGSSQQAVLARRCSSVAVVRRPSLKGGSLPLCPQQSSMVVVDAECSLTHETTIDIVLFIGASET